MAAAFDFDESRTRRAVAGYRRFQHIKAAVSLLFWAALLIAAVIVGIRAGCPWGLGTFVIGSPVGAALLGLLIMTPLGYLLCGKDAMTLGRAIERDKAERR